MSCVFCDIVNGIIPAKIIATSEHAIAFLDVSPVSDGHTLVITKKHYKCFSETPDEVLADVTLLAKKVANLIDGTLKPWGFNYLSNEGAVAGQVVFHFHLHVIPKYAKNEGFAGNVLTQYVTDVNTIYEKLIKQAKKLDK